MLLLEVLFVVGSIALFVIADYYVKGCEKV